jgi:hypothetical protein
MFTFRRFIGAAALATAVLLTGCKGNPAAPQGNYGTIVGTVKSTNGQPIAGATVTADSVITAQTGADGKYTIQTVPIDSPTTTTAITCHATGYQDPPAQHVSVAAGKQIEADFTLSAQ